MMRVKRPLCLAAAERSGAWCCWSVSDKGKGGAREGTASVNEGTGVVGSARPQRRGFDGTSRMRQEPLGPRRWVFAFVF